VNVVVESSFILEIEGFNDKDSLQPETFKIKDNELYGFSLDYKAIDSKNAKSSNEYRLITVKGSIEWVLASDPNLMHLLRRWSKQPFDGWPGIENDYAKADDFYKKVKISFYHADTEIRTITYKNAYIYEYTENIDPRNNTGVFELTVRQNEEFAENGVVL
jgi:hypothetical protein